jgi:hypothetical protein
MWWGCEGEVAGAAESRGGEELCLNGQKEGETEPGRAVVQDQLGSWELLGRGTVVKKEFRARLGPGGEGEYKSITLGSSRGFEHRGP